MPYVKNVWVDNAPPDISAANLSHMEAGIGAAPYGPDGSSGFVPVGDGSGAWVYKKITNAEIDAAAAIAYTKLVLTGSIVNGDINAAAAIARTKLDFGAGLVNADIAAAAAIAISKLAGYPGDATKFVRGDGTWAVPPAAVSYRKTTAKAATNTVAETDLLNGEITVAANALSTSGVLRLTAWGDWVQNTGGARDVPRFKFKLGGTTIIDTNAIGTNVTAASATRYPWRIVVELMNLGAANSQWASFVGDILFGAGSASGQTAFATGEGLVSTVSLNVSGTPVHAEYKGANSAAVDTTAGQALVLSVINPTNTGTCETKLYGALIEIV